MCLSGAPWAMWCKDTSTSIHIENCSFPFGQHVTVCSLPALDSKCLVENEPYVSSYRNSRPLWKCVRPTLALLPKLSFISNGWSGWWIVRLCVIPKSIFWQGNSWGKKVARMFWCTVWTPWQSVFRPMDHAVDVSFLGSTLSHTRYRTGYMFVQAELDLKGLVIGDNSKLQAGQLVVKTKHCAECSKTFFCIWRWWIGQKHKVSNWMPHFWILPQSADFPILQPSSGQGRSHKNDLHYRFMIKRNRKIRMKNIPSWLYLVDRRYKWLDILILNCSHSQVRRISNQQESAKEDLCCNAITNFHDLANDQPWFVDEVFSKTAWNSPTLVGPLPLVCWLTCWVWIRRRTWSIP